MDDTAKRAMQWIASNDTGLSSKSIWRHFMGLTSSGRWSHPLDPSDFGRCARLLEIMPEWRARISEMAKYSEAWKRLVARWDDIEKLMKDEVGIHGEKGNVARKTYELMADILGDAKW